MAINFAILGLGMIAKVMASTILQMNKSGDKTVKLYAAASRSLENHKAFVKNSLLKKLMALMTSCITIIILI